MDLEQIIGLALAIVAPLVASQVLVVRTLLKRTEKAAETRDENLAALIAALTESLAIHAETSKSFAAFEAEEKETNRAITDDLKAVGASIRTIAEQNRVTSETLQLILEQLRSITERLGRLEAANNTGASQ